MSSFPPKLTHVTDQDPGISRRVCGRGYTYFLPSGRRLRSKKRRQRINELGIPPAWMDVWICNLPDGHLQATGQDSAGRKQYIYHPEWETYSKQKKYDRLINFGQHLPKIRRQYHKDLQRKKWDQRRVLALATALLDELYLRVGSNRYTEQNSSYGLTTLRRKHLDFEEGVALLNYRAKLGKERTLKVKDQELKKMLRECSELQGYELFRYKSATGFESINSRELNSYLNETTSGEGFSAKDFRTWGANCLALKNAPRAKEICSKNSRKKLETTLVKLVAKEMGNGVNICRKYYIHPEVLKVALTQKRPDKFNRSKNTYSPEERWLTKILT